jgi:hypothetical protein
VVLAAVVAGVIVIAGVTALSISAYRKNSCDGPVSVQQDVAQSTSNSPPEGGLRIVEQGFSQLTGSVDVGAIIENTSQHIAYRTQVTFTLFDNGHRSVVPQSAPQVHLEIPVILPKQRIGVGRNIGVAVTVSGFAVSPKPAQWLTLRGGEHVAPATARYTKDDESPGLPGFRTFHYTAATSLCHQVPRNGEGVIFRNKAGAIVGGLYVENSPVTKEIRQCRPDEHSEEVSLLEAVTPQRAEPRRTDIYPYCALAI